jgi:hypothetical protein
VPLGTFKGVANDDFRGVFIKDLFEGVFNGLLDEFFFGVFWPLPVFLGDWIASNFKFLLKCARSLLKNLNLCEQAHRVENVI